MHIGVLREHEHRIGSANPSLLFYSQSSRIFLLMISSISVHRWRPGEGRCPRCGHWTTAPGSGYRARPTSRSKVRPGSSCSPCLSAEGGVRAFRFFLRPPRSTIIIQLSRTMRLLLISSSKEKRAEVPSSEKVQAISFCFYR